VKAGGIELGTRHALVVRVAAMSILVAAAASLIAPATVFAHELTERYAAPLPLIAYLAAAALAVAISFAFIILRNAPTPAEPARGRARAVPGWLRGLLGAVGLIAWLWIVAQTIVGGAGDGDVASLFLWVYGWVALPLVSAFIGPAWAWIDPFTTLHAALGWVGRRLGISGAEPADYPARLGRWPAVLGFAVVVWIELVGHVQGGRTLGLVLIAYTLITLAAMSYFGRETWRSRGEIFSVWLGLVGRIAPIELDGEPEAGLVRRRPFAAGLLATRWTTDEVVLVALATGAIIFDGLSQTQQYFDLFISTGAFGVPVVRDTITAVVFLGLVIAMVLAVVRRLGTAALGAGLLPVAIGYLIAHYLTYLLVDGQRLIFAMNDPLLRGDNLLPLDLSAFEPTLFLPTAIVWTIQLAAVVGGHIVGAWAGHAALMRTEKRERTGPLRQLPLAALMVVLTTITLWSLGQTVLIETVAAAAR
jgi:hypothetical protein